MTASYHALAIAFVSGDAHRRVSHAFAKELGGQVRKHTSLRSSRLSTLRSSSSTSETSRDTRRSGPLSRSKHVERSSKLAPDAHPPGLSDDLSALASPAAAAAASAVPIGAAPVAAPATSASSSAKHATCVRSRLADFECRSVSSVTSYVTCGPLAAREKSVAALAL